MSAFFFWSVFLAAVAAACKLVCSLAIFTAGSSEAEVAAAAVPTDWAFEDDDWMVRLGSSGLEVVRLLDEAGVWPRFSLD